LVAKDLVLQHEQMHWIRGAADIVPDLERVAAVSAAPGLCIGFRAPDGHMLQRLCSGTEPRDAWAPRAFASLYEGLLGTDREFVRPVRLRGAMRGEAVVTIDRETLIAASWRDTSRLGAIMAVAFVALCLLVYAALARALRPTRAIAAGLERLAGGDLSTRLPVFDLAELSVVGKVFNHLAERLEATLAERNALTQRLIGVQDEERRHLARELHDEFGQCLAAISAVAASAAYTARLECPALAPECQSIARTAARMMEALRGTLLRLRPPELDELGLAASLEGLVAGWNRRGGGTRFSLELSDGLDALPCDLAASIYRMAQEAITNAVKHAQASRVRLRLRLEEERDRQGRRQIELTVDDDGRFSTSQAAGPGMGLLGIRERVAALGGRLSIEPSRPSGLVLRVLVPVPPPGTAQCVA
jgi:signal transduction histidine kinase